MNAEVYPDSRSTVVDSRDIEWNASDTFLNDSLETVLYFSFVVTRRGKVRKIEFLKWEGDTLPEPAMESLISEAKRLLKMTSGEYETKNKGPVKFVIPIRFVTAADQDGNNR